MKKIKAFLIARVSDPAQIEALPAQKLRLENYIKNKNLDNYEYFEFNETAYKEDRQKFEKIIEKIIIDSNFYYCILVFDKVDRLTRDSASTVVGKLKNLAKSGKIEIHFPSDNLYISENTPATEIAHFGVNTVFAEYYSGAISDNVKRRFEQKRNDGEWCGKAPIGYQNITLPNGQKDIILDTLRAPFIKEIFEMRIDGYSYRSIAKTMREKGLYSNTKNQTPIKQSNVEQILNNPFYYGKMRVKDVLYSHKYEPIIDFQTFKLSQQVGKNRQKNKSKSIRKYNFTFANGLVKCGYCGCSMSSYFAKGNIYLQCSKAKMACKNNCAEKILINQLSDEVFSKISITEDIAEMILSEIRSKENQKIDLIQKSLINLQNRYAKLANQQDILYEDRLNGRITIDKYDKFANKILEEMDEIDSQIKRLSTPNKSIILNASYLLSIAKNADNLFKSSKPEQKNKILKLLLSNPKIKEKRLYFNLLEPFLTLSNCRKTQIWLRQLGSNQRPIG